MNIEELKRLIGLHNKAQEALRRISEAATGPSRELSAACGLEEQTHQHIRDWLHEYVDDIIAMAERDAACRDAGFIGEDGKWRKVLGTLWISEDGWIIGDNAPVSSLVHNRDGTVGVGIAQSVCGKCDDFSCMDPPPKVWAVFENAKAAAAKEARDGQA